MDLCKLGDLGDQNLPAPWLFPSLFQGSSSPHHLRHIPNIPCRSGFPVSGVTSWLNKKCLKERPTGSDSRVPGVFLESHDSLQLTGLSSLSHQRPLFSPQPLLSSGFSGLLSSDLSPSDNGRHRLDCGPLVLSYFT